MTTKLARQDGLAQGPTMEPELQAFVNLTFLNMIIDPFMNGEVVPMAAAVAARQLNIPPAKAEKMLKQLTQFNERVKKASGLEGFMP